MNFGFDASDQGHGGIVRTVFTAYWIVITAVIALYLIVALTVE